ERVRRQGVGHEDGPVLEDGPVREVHAGTSWAWNRTTVRCASTRYARATARTCSARTFSTFARSASPNSHEPRPSPALRRMPWNVTPSCSYRAQARTCWRARASSAFGGGALELLDLSVEHRLDTIEGGAAGEGHARDQQRRVELHLLPHADVRREPRVDERPIQAVRTGLPVARGEGHRPAPAAEDRRQEDERRDIV